MSEMTKLEKLGKIRTLLISASIILISLHTIITYQLAHEGPVVKKLIQQIIRFGLTITLLYFLYKGNKWVRNIGLVLFALAFLGAIAGIFTTNSDLISKTPLIVMALIYGLAVYFFGFSTEYAVFREYQRDKT